MNGLPKGTRIFLPAGMANLYENQERLEISRINSLKRHHKKNRRYLEHHNSSRFRIKQITSLLGLSVWAVNGWAIRRELHVDFTMGGHSYRYLFIPLNEIWIDQNNTRKGDLWPTIWHEFFERILMRQKASYDAAHRMASRLKIILRNGKIFVLPVGVFRQSKGYCGPAAAKIYLNYLGKNLSEKYLARLFKTTVGLGTDPANLKEAMEKMGYRVEHRGRPIAKRNIRPFCRESGTTSEALTQIITNVQKMARGVTLRRSWTAKAVKDSIRRGLPVLANVQDGPGYGDGHYCLIIGFTKDTFIVSDPQEDAGYRETPIADFMKLWYELEDGTYREGFTIEP